MALDWLGLDVAPADLAAQSAFLNKSWPGPHAIEPALATLIFSPDEVLSPDTCCPRPQCRLTDKLSVKSYDAAVRVAHIDNSRSHLILALSHALQSSGVDQSM